MQLQNKQASRPLHVHTTMQPSSKKLLYIKKYLSETQNPIRAPTLHTNVIKAY